MQQLDQNSSLQISADQLISDSQTIVKELVENSLDAQSTVIRISLLNNGIDQIQVSDNGIGINPNNFSNLTKRGATSKIQNVSDISNVRSFGFRGEALSYICCMSQVEVVSNGGQGGWRVKFDNLGNIKEQVQDDHAQGTTVNITKIFENFPVRRKHLQTKKQLGDIIKAIKNCAILSKNVRFILENDGKSILSFPQCNDFYNRIFQIYQFDQNNTIKVQERFADFCIKGVISHPNLARSPTVVKLLIINKRVVKAPGIISRAIQSAYYELGKDVFWIIKLKLQESQLDINVEPSKDRVILSHKEAISARIQELLRETLTKYSSVFNYQTSANLKRSFSQIDQLAPLQLKQPKLGSFRYEPKPNYIHPVSEDPQLAVSNIRDPQFNTDGSASSSNNQETKLEESKISIQEFEQPQYWGNSKFKTPRQSQTKEIAIKMDLCQISKKPEMQYQQQIQLPDCFHFKNKGSEEQFECGFTKENFAKLRVIGQFNKGFILTILDQTQDVFIVDQHAADEKYLFEHYINTTQIQKQYFISPQVLQISHEQEIVLEDKLQILDQIGFSIEKVIYQGTSAFLLKSVPAFKRAVLTVNDAIEAIHNLIQYKDCNDQQQLLNLIKPTKFRSIFASRACRKAVMIGDSLTLNQMKQIVSNLSILRHPWNCPHGRPTMRLISNFQSFKIKDYS